MGCSRLAIKIRLNQNIRITNRVMTYADFIVYFGASLTIILKLVSGIKYMLSNSFHNFIGRKVL